MVKLFELLKEEIYTKYERNIFYIRCRAHVINLVVQEGLKYISGVELIKSTDQANQANKTSLYKQKSKKKKSKKRKSIITKLIAITISLSTDTNNLVNQEDLKNLINKLRNYINTIWKSIKLLDKLKDIYKKTSQKFL